ADKLLKALKGHVKHEARKENENQQNHSEIKISNPTEFQNHEKQENQDLRATANVPSPPDEHQGAENAVSSVVRMQEDIVYSINIFEMFSMFQEFY
ncbi:hypothetical protein H8959_016893, partial [Pygathrix nigripes]